MLIGGSHKYGLSAALFIKCACANIGRTLHGLLAHWTICIAHESMNMHPGDPKLMEENEEPDVAQKEKTTPPVGHSRSSEMTKTPIHVDAEVGFLVVLLISRLRWVLSVFAFGAVYAAAFWGFVGLISAAFIGRGFHQKGGQIDFRNRQKK